MSLVEGEGAGGGCGARDRGEPHPLTPSPAPSALLSAAADELGRGGRRDGDEAGDAAGPLHADQGLIRTCIPSFRPGN